MAKSNFSARTIQQFQAMLKVACQRNPNRTFVDLMVQWRGAKELNHASKRVLNYGSYLIEANPGLGSRPILCAFFV